MIRSQPRGWWVFAGVLLVLAAVGVSFLSARAQFPRTRSSGTNDVTYTVKRGDFVHSVRLSGTVEAVEATTVAAPRIAGPSTSSLVISRLIPAGSRVQPGDLLVEFDRQVQLSTALDRRAELNDLEQQIRRRTAEENAARAKDESELLQAQSAVTKAELEMAKNELISRIMAEKNTQALAQAQARLEQLKKTFDLKRRAAAADIGILEIRRDKAQNAMKMAETNAARMEVRSPIAGLAVIRTMWKSSGMAEIVEGEEIRAGVPVVDIVNPSRMRVRVRVNQSDINDLKPGQPVRVGLDAYPDLSFGGEVSRISPLAVTSTLSPKVRYFTMLVDVHGSHERLMPDLTASLDVQLAKVPQAIVIPRDAISYEEGRAIVRVRQGSGYEPRDVSLGAMSNVDAVVTSGLDEGAVIQRPSRAVRP